MVGPRPNGDGTFQMRVWIPLVLKDTDGYQCLVEKDTNQTTVAWGMLQANQTPIAWGMLQANQTTVTWGMLQTNQTPVAWGMLQAKVVAFQAMFWDNPDA